MAITEHTRKVLWSLSGNACARCSESLVTAPEAVGDPHAIVGRECHIVARSAEGPRGQSGSRDDIDGYANLILLCANCHATVDGQVQQFPSDVLERLKKEHEARVARRSGSGLPEFRLEGRDAPLRLQLIKSGDELLGIISSSCSGGYDTPPVLSSNQREAVRDFLETCESWGEIFSELGPKDRFDAAQHVQDGLDGLRDEALVVYAGTRFLRLHVEDRISPWPETAVRVVHGSEVRVSQPESRQTAA